MLTTVILCTFFIATWAMSGLWWIALLLTVGLAEFFNIVANAFRR